MKEMGNKKFRKTLVTTGISLFLGLSMAIHPAMAAAEDISADTELLYEAEEAIEARGDV